MKIKFQLVLWAALLALLPASANADMRYGGGMHPMMRRSMPPPVRVMPHGGGIAQYHVQHSEPRYAPHRFVERPRMEHRGVFARSSVFHRRRGFRNYGGFGYGSYGSSGYVAGAAVIGGYGYSRWHHHERYRAVSVERPSSAVVSRRCGCNCCCPKEFPAVYAAPAVDLPADSPADDEDLTQADIELLQRVYK